MDYFAALGYDVWTVDHEGYGRSGWSGHGNSDIQTGAKDLAAVGALLLVAFFSAFISSVPTWIAVLLGLALFLIPAYYHLRQKMVRYTLTDAKVEIDEGFVFQNSRNVPLRSIQDVSVSSTITQRMLGFGNLVIDNASEDGGKIILKNINTPKKYADILLKQMRLLDK